MAEPALDDASLVQQYLTAPVPRVGLHAAVMDTQAQVEEEMAARRDATNELLQAPVGPGESLEESLRPYGFHPVPAADGPRRYWIRAADGVKVLDGEFTFIDARIRHHICDKDGFNARHRRLQRARAGLHALEDPMTEAQSDAVHDAFGQD